MRLHAVERGSGPPVLLLHGLFGAGRNLGALQLHLAATHRAIAMDLRNHGHSPHAPGMDYATLAADVAETLDTLGVSRCAVLGHSMGGKVAMRLALDQPHRVARLLVADIAPVRYPGGFDLITAALQSIDLSPGLSRGTADAALAPTIPEPALRAFLLSNLQPGLQPAWRFGLDAIAAGLPDIYGWADSDRPYEGPALFVQGDRSDYILPSHLAAIRTQFPQATLAVLANAGHWLHADNPAGFAILAEDFFR